MRQILNTFRSTPTKNVYYDHVGNEVYRNGDFAIYVLPASYLYTYKEKAINELAGLNKPHLDALAAGIRPNDSQQGFLYDLAFEKVKAIA